MSDATTFYRQSSHPDAGERTGECPEHGAYAYHAATGRDGDCPACLRSAFADATAADESAVDAAEAADALTDRALSLLLKVPFRTGGVVTASYECVCGYAVHREDTLAHATACEALRTLTLTEAAK
jgi:hypothetical protein